MTRHASQGVPGPRWKTAVMRFLRDDTGATAVEYAIMLALILGLIIIGVQTVGDETSGFWQVNSDEIHKALEQARQ